MAVSSSKDVEVEREYVINLRRTREVSRTKRAPYAIRLLRRMISRHMHVDPENVKISSDVSEIIWSRGIEKPPRRIKVKVVKRKDGTVLVTL